MRTRAAVLAIRLEVGSRSAGACWGILRLLPIAAFRPGLWLRVVRDHRHLGRCVVGDPLTGTCLAAGRLCSP